MDDDDSDEYIPDGSESDDESDDEHDDMETEEVIIKADEISDGVSRSNEQKVSAYWRHYYNVV
jgi:hypothetical protein